MELKLSDEEALRIGKYRNRLAAAEQQIRQIRASGDEIADVINISWEAAHMRAQLSDPEFAERLNGEPVPPMINAMGQELVRFDAKTRTASWDTAHDVKRVAKEPKSDVPLVVEEKSEEMEKTEEVEYTIEDAESEVINPDDDDVTSVNNSVEEACDE